MWLRYITVAGLVFIMIFELAPFAGRASLHPFTDANARRQQEIILGHQTVYRVRSREAQDTPFYESPRRPLHRPWTEEATEVNQDIKSTPELSKRQQTPLPSPLLNQPHIAFNWPRTTTWSALRQSIQLIANSPLLSTGLVSVAFATVLGLNGQLTLVALSILISGFLPLVAGLIELLDIVNNESNAEGKQASVAIAISFFLGGSVLFKFSYLLYRFEPVLWHRRASIISPASFSSNLSQSLKWDQLKGYNRIAHFIFLIATLIIAILEVAWRIAIAANSGRVASIARGSSALQIILLAEISAKLTYSSIKTPSAGLTRFSTIKEIGFMLSGNGLGLAAQIVAFEVIGFSDTPLGRSLGFLQVYMYIIDAAICCARSDPEARNRNFRGPPALSSTRPGSDSSFTGTAFVGQSDLTRPFSQFPEYEAPPTVSLPAKTRLTSWSKRLTTWQSQSQTIIPLRQSISAREKSSRDNNGFQNDTHTTRTPLETSQFGEESKGIMIDSSRRLSRAPRRPPTYSKGAIPQTLREEKKTPLHSQSMISLPLSRVSVTTSPYHIQTAQKIRASHDMWMDIPYDIAGSRPVLDNAIPCTDQYSPFTSQNPSLSALFSAYFPGAPSSHSKTSPPEIHEKNHPSSEGQNPALKSQSSISLIRMHDNVDLSSASPPAPPPRTALPSTPKASGRGSTAFPRNPSALKSNNSHAAPFSNPAQPSRTSESWSPSWLRDELDNFSTAQVESRAGSTSSMTFSFFEQSGRDSALSQSGTTSSFLSSNLLDDLREISHDQSHTAASLASFERLLSRYSSREFWNFNKTPPSLGNQNEEISRNPSILFSLEASKAEETKQAKNEDHSTYSSEAYPDEPSPLRRNPRDEVRETNPGGESPEKTRQLEPFGKEINVTSFIGSLISNDVGPKQTARSEGSISRSSTSKDLGDLFYEIAPHEVAISQESLESGQLNIAEPETDSTIPWIRNSENNALTPEVTQESTASLLALEPIEIDYLPTKLVRLSNTQSDIDSPVGDVQFVDEKFGSAVGQIVGLNASNDPVGGWQETHQMSEPRQELDSHSTADILESRGNRSSLEPNEFPIALDLQDHTQQNLSPIVSHFQTHPFSFSGINPSLTTTIKSTSSYSPEHPFEQPRPAPQPPIF